MYRVSRDVPLPYKFPNKTELDDEDYDSAAQGKSTSRFEKLRLRRRPASRADKLNEVEHHFEADLASNSEGGNENNLSHQEEQTSGFKARLRSKLAPDADLSKRIDQSGAARGSAGKDYDRKNVPALDVDSDDE